MPNLIDGKYSLGFFDRIGTPGGSLLRYNKVFKFAPTTNDQANGYASFLNQYNEKYKSAPYTTTMFMSIMANVYYTRSYATGVTEYHEFLPGAYEYDTLEDAKTAISTLNGVFGDKKVVLSDVTESARRVMVCIPKEDDEWNGAFLAPSDADLGNVNGFLPANGFIEGFEDPAFPLDAHTWFASISNLVSMVTYDNGFTNFVGTYPEDYNLSTKMKSSYVDYDSTKTTLVPEYFTPIDVFCVEAKPNKMGLVGGVSTYGLHIIAGRIWYGVQAVGGQS